MSTNRRLAVGASNTAELFDHGDIEVIEEMKHPYTTDSSKQYYVFKGPNSLSLIEFITSADTYICPLTYNNYYYRHDYEQCRFCGGNANLYDHLKSKVFLPVYKSDERWGRYITMFDDNTVDLTPVVYHSDMVKDLANTRYIKTNKFHKDLTWKIYRLITLSNFVLPDKELVDKALTYTLHAQQKRGQCDPDDPDVDNIINTDHDAIECRNYTLDIFIQIYHAFEYKEFLSDMVFKLYLNRVKPRIIKKLKRDKVYRRNIAFITLFDIVMPYALERYIR